jgi:hypothetical protein
MQKKCSIFLLCRSRQLKDVARRAISYQEVRNMSLSVKLNAKSILSTAFLLSRVYCSRPTTTPCITQTLCSSSIGSIENRWNSTRAKEADFELGVGRVEADLLLIDSWTGYL